VDKIYKSSTVTRFIVTVIETAKGLLLLLLLFVLIVFYFLLDFKR